MPPKRNKPPPKSAAVVEGWRDQDLSDLTEGQIAYLAANPDVDAASVIATIRKKRAHVPAAIPAALESSDDEWGAETSQMATGPDFPFFFFFCINGTVRWTFNSKVYTYKGIGVILIVPRQTRISKYGRPTYMTRPYSTSP
jgi:hypothetical protein